MNWYLRHLVAAISPEQHGVTLKGRGVQVPEEIQQEIISAYKRGKNSSELAVEYNCAPATIISILKRHNIARRPSASARKDVSKYQLDQIISLYTQGNPVAFIARRLGFYPHFVQTLLRENNIPLRPDLGRPKKFTPEESQEIIQKYRNGKSIFQLARDYQCSSTVIRSVLIRNGIEIVARPPNSATTWKPLTETERNQILNLRNQGYSSYAISRTLNINHGTVYYHLRKNNLLNLPSTVQAASNWYIRQASQTHQQLIQNLQPVINKIKELFPELTGIELGGSAARNEMDQKPNKKSDIDIIIRLPKKLDPFDTRHDELFQLFPKFQGRTVDFIITSPNGNYVGQQRFRWENNLPTPTVPILGEPYDETADKEQYLEKLRKYQLTD